MDSYKRTIKLENHKLSGSTKKFEKLLTDTNKTQLHLTTSATKIEIVIAV